MATIAIFEASPSPKIKRISDRRGEERPMMRSRIVLEKPARAFTSFLPTGAEIFISILLLHPEGGPAGPHRATDSRSNRRARRTPAAHATRAHGADARTEHRS